MNSALRRSALGALLLFCLAPPASGQYMKITTDNSSDNTRLRPNGQTTLLTITLDSNHDRNGTPQTCGSHQAALCGGAATGENLDVFSYTIILTAAGGTVSWGSFTPADPAYGNGGAPPPTSTQVEINYGRASGVTPAGAFTLGTIPVTGVSGSPAIQFARGPNQPIDPSSFGTLFGTGCSAGILTGSYLLGDPADPCGAGIGDWFDADGVLAGGDNFSQPVISAPATAGGTEGTPIATITATASDADVGQTLTITQTGMPSDLTFSSAPSFSPTTATISGTPGFSDAGTHNIVWTVNDGAGGVSSTGTVLTIAGTNRAPTLNPIPNQQICEGSTKDQSISGSDPDGDPLTFTKVTGPSYMAVTTTSPTTGNIHFSPGFADAGTDAGTVRASDGSLSDDKSFTIAIINACFAPVLNQPSNMTVNEGATADQTITATSAGGSALFFSKVSGPSFMTVTTTSPGTGTATGNIHLAPGFADQGTYTASVRVSDGSLTDTKSFLITVFNINDAPVLNPIANMTVCNGATADQAISGSDPQGDPLTFSKTAGPTYMTVTTASPTTGNIHLAPPISTPSGTAAATVSASDGSLSASRSFLITIPICDFAPVLNQPANMTVNEGSIADQTITATTFNGTPLTFFKASGPSFMTVTTTSPGTGTATGNIHLAPGFVDAGTYSATVTVTDGVLTNSKSLTITVANVNRPPALIPPAPMTLNEGSTADQVVTASDPDNDPLTFSKASGPSFMSVTTTSPTTGNIHLAPGPSDAGTYTGTISVSDGFASASGSFPITVNSFNRCPTANPGPSVSGLVNIAVTFDGSASSDPDGNPLTYHWDFDASDGITVDAVGPVVSHAYATAGAYTVTLTVTDNGNGHPTLVCSASATTTATIVDFCPATIFNGYDTIRLSAGRPFWFANVQPQSGCYTNTDVVLSSFVLKYAGRQIPAEAGKTSIAGDKSGDGIAEIRVSFSKDNLRTLFSGTGLANGHNLVTVTIEANLTNGGSLQGTTQIDVVNNGSFTSASVAPNPLNPSAVLTFTTQRPGSVRIEMFDAQGRLVRRLLDEGMLAAGIHQVRIDGRGASGEKLASGIYYIRGRSDEGTFERSIAILK